ncbi:MAG: hypothetical protein RL117_133 [Verrucomicrobiota bacterium]|jgi:hypothetical protein
MPAILECSHLLQKKDKKNLHTDTVHENICSHEYLAHQIPSFPLPLEKSLRGLALLLHCLSPLHGRLLAPPTAAFNTPTVRSGTCPIKISALTDFALTVGRISCY